MNYLCTFLKRFWLKPFFFHTPFFHSRSFHLFNFPIKNSFNSSNTINSAESFVFLRVYRKQFPSLILILKMCGIICYFTNPNCNIHVAGPINTALTMLQHRGQGPFFYYILICRCLWNYNMRWRTDNHG